MYYKTLINLLIVVCFLSKYSNAQGDDVIFRTDYKYIPSLEGFYKIHTVRKSWIDAERICLNEGTDVLRPSSLDKILEFIAVLEFVNETQPADSLANSLSSILGKEGHIYFDGLPLSELYSNWNPNQNNAHPFVCKKTYDTMEWNHECNLPILGYIYSEDVDRCYKLHADPMNWTDAYDTCKHEQSYLAIINSNKEAEFLIELMENLATENFNSYYNGVAHLGFRKENNQWMTIDGTKLEDSSYTRWRVGQPDGPSRGVDESCGSMDDYGDLNDIGCQTKSPFVCEHEISTLSSLNGHRLKETHE